MLFYRKSPFVKTEINFSLDWRRFLASASRTFRSPAEPPSGHSFYFPLIIEFPNVVKFFRLCKLTRICARLSDRNRYPQFLILLRPVIRDFFFAVAKLHWNHIKNRKNFCNVLRTVELPVMGIKGVIIMAS